MWKWLMPKSTNFFDYFEKHIAVVLQAAEKLLSLLSSDQEFLPKLQKIRQLEHEADEITYQCVKDLHSTFITPFPRNDILKLISNMDDIIDYIEETSQMIVTYRITSLSSEAKQLGKILVDSVREINGVINQLNSLKKINETRQSLNQVHQNENEGDKIYLKAIGSLFIENNDPLVIIKWKDIYHSLENAIDTCQLVANIIEGVILESN